MLITFIPITVLAEGESVVKIGETEYETLASAISVVKQETPTTITLLKSFTASSFEIPSNTNITLDLNGYTLDLGEGKYGVELNSGSTFTLTDSGNGGVLKFRGTSGSNRTAIYSSGSSQTINIQGGTVEMTSAGTNAFYAVKATGPLNISGGTVKASGLDSIYKKPIAIGAQSSSLVITGGTIIAEGSPKSDGSYAAGIGIEFKNASSCTVSIADSVHFSCTMNDIDAQNQITVTGGVFNNIDLTGTSGSSFTKSTINGTVDLNNNECTFTNVIFGEDAVLDSTRYILQGGAVLPSTAPQITFATNDAAMGLVKIDSYSFSNPSASGSIASVESKTWYVNSGSTATVAATAVPADKNHEFVGWYNTDSTSGEKLSENTTVTYTASEGGVTANVTYYAVFQETEAYAAMKVAAAAWASGETFTISSKDEMGYFAYAVNELGKDFSGKTVTLTADLTYTDADSFTPIGTAAKHFMGTFDGGGHTITGLSADGTYSMTDTGSYLGLFGYTSGAVIKDLTLSGVDFDGAYMAGGFAGEANSTTFTNCTLTGGSTISYAYYTGGLFGHSSGGCTVTGCTVENSVLDGPWKTGGITGYADGVTISDTTVNNTAVEGTGAGALIGHANAGNTKLTNVTVSDVKDEKGEKTLVIGTTYAGGDSCSITVSGDSTRIDAAGLVPSGSEAPVQVTGGDFTFEIPSDYIPTTEGEEKKISVTFKSDGETVIVQVIKAGETVTLPNAPSKDGYTFRGWYLENGTYVTAKTEFTESTTVFAKWKANSTSSDHGSNSYAISLPGKVTGGEVSLSKHYAEKGDTITITVTPDDGYELAELIVTDSRGNALVLTEKSGGRFTFQMPADPVEIAVSFRKIVNPFTDVSTGDYYYEAILWAVANGVTNGTSAAAFSPDAPVSRAQLVTFLWRAHGSPRATGENPFTDVSTGDYYYEAVLWAVANGVTNGTSATTFSPDAAVTRAQAVTFQWRAAGSPAVSGSSFEDVAADAYYADAVIWAVAGGITNGTGGNTFSPDVVVTRAQAVTFLFRELAE